LTDEEQSTKMIELLLALEVGGGRATREDGDEEWKSDRSREGDEFLRSGHRREVEGGVVVGSRVW